LIKWTCPFFVWHRCHVPESMHRKGCARVRKRCPVPDLKPFPGHHIGILGDLEWWNKIIVPGDFVYGASAWSVETSLDVRRLYASEVCNIPEWCALHCRLDVKRFVCAHIVTDGFTWEDAPHARVPRHRTLDPLFRTPYGAWGSGPNPISLPLSAWTRALEAHMLSWICIEGIRAPLIPALVGRSRRRHSRAAFCVRQRHGASPTDETFRWLFYPAERTNHGMRTCRLRRTVIVGEPSAP